MKTLYVLRHGQAVPEGEAESDHERVLTARGRVEVRLVAEHLAGRSQSPSLILSSTAARARATAEACLRALPPQTRLTLAPGLYLAEPAGYVAALVAGGDPHEAVLVVGHNPGLEALVYMLTERSEHLATASLVEIGLPIAVWSDLSRKSAVITGRCEDHFRVRP
jgi:phosphohistidine phosphatase